MAGVWHDAVLERIEPLTPRMRSFFFSGPWAALAAVHAAGQHVDVRLTAPDGYTAQRSYSIASPPGSDELELIIERLDDGEVSPFFHDIARAGDTIEMRGPLGGHFVWRLDDGGPLLLVAGGSGIAPLMAMVRTWAGARAIGSAGQRAHTPVLLVYSARTAADLAFADELRALQANDAGFRLVAVVTREPALRPGDLGRRLDAAAIRDVLAAWGHTPRHVFVCGANRFVEAVANGLVDAGIAPGVIRTERYGGA